MFETPKVGLKYSSNRITTQNATVARITLTLCLFLTVSCVLRRTILLNQIRAKTANITLTMCVLRSFLKRIQ